LYRKSARKKNKVGKRKKAPDPNNVFNRKIHYPLLPHQMRTKLSYSQRTTSGTAKGTIGLVHYLNNTPLYMDALYQIYTYSRIEAVDIHIEVVNLDTVPYDFVVAVCPQGTISTITLDMAKQSQGSILKIVGGSAGQNRVIIKKHYDCEKLIGYHLADRDTRMNFSDANSSSYADSSLPAITFFPSVITGAVTSGVSMSVVVNYHVVFFDIYVPSTSAIKKDDFTVIAEQKNQHSCQALGKPCMNRF
jgi:hypothetical protein